MLIVCGKYGQFFLLVAYTYEIGKKEQDLESSTGDIVLFVKQLQIIYRCAPECNRASRQLLYGTWKCQMKFVLLIRSVKLFSQSFI